MSYDMRCADAGAVGCRGRTRADSEEEFLAKLSRHLRAKHGVTAPTETIVAHLLAVAQQDTDPPSRPGDTQRGDELPDLTGGGRHSAGNHR